MSSERSGAQPDVASGDESLWAEAAMASPVGMSLVALDGTLWMPNQAFAQMLGYRQVALQGMTFQEITYPADLRQDLDLLEETLRGARSSYRILKRYRHADGGVVWADLSVTLLRDAAGEPRHFVAQMLDVTAQRLDLDRLAEAVDTAERERALSAAVLETADVGLVLVDREGRYERVNRRQREIIAAAFPDREEGQEGGPGHLYAGDGTTRLSDDERPEARAVRGEEFDDVRIWVGDDPSARRALSVSARAVRSSAGEPAGAVLAFSDVTDLVQALRARDVFETSVSHELRTPLTTVLGRLEILLEDDDMSAVATHQLRTVQRNATRLRHLVSDLLDPAARVEGGVVLSRSEVDVAELVREVAESMAPTAARARITFSVDAPGPAPAFVDGDRLGQVVENLLSNAFKYTDAGGEVALVVAALDGAVVVHVHDTGIGIPPEQVPHLFDPFFRTEHARERMASGLGLGLGIVRSIMTAHGGDIEVRSEPGRGSVFRIEVPVTVRVPVSGP